MPEKDSLKSNIQDYNRIRLERDRNQVCHAPFVSLNFEQSGKVTACCYNRTHIVGQYPNQSIAAIWSSPAIDELRKSIEKLDFSKGCEKCSESLLSKNYFSPLMKNYDQLSSNGWEAAKTGPRIFEFELSNLCNLECAMCTGFFSSSIRKNREKLSALKFPWDDNFVEQLKPFWKTVEWAKFLGGEPFLIPIYFKIWKQIAEENKNVKVVITTNGTIWNKRVESILEDLKPRIVLSIDSFQKNTYEKIRVNANHKDTMKNLTKFVIYGRINFRTVDIVVCPMTTNWQDLPEIFDWGIRNVVQVSFNTVHFPKELSLMNADKVLLNKILKSYEVVNLPRIEDLIDNPPKWPKIVSEANRNRFESLKSQIRSWAVL